MKKKKCIKCGYENSVDSLFCEDCGARFAPSAEGLDSSATPERSVSSESVVNPEKPMSVGGGSNSAVLADDIVSGGKNNTSTVDDHSTSTIDDHSISTVESHSTSTIDDHSSTVSNTSITNGMTATDLQSILSVVMDANMNTVKQVLESQQAMQQDQSQSGGRGNTSNKGQGGSTQGGVDKADDEYNEYQLVAANLQTSILGVNERMTNIKAPEMSYYMRDYHFIIWIAASIFIFFLAAATAINILWFALLGALGMVVFSLIKRFKGKEAEPKRVKFDEASEKYKSIRSTVVSAFGENNAIITIGDNLIDEATEKFEAAERKAMKDAKVTTAIICGAMFAVGYLVVSIVIG